MPKKKPVNISDLTDYELEKFYNQIASEVDELQGVLEAINFEKRNREIPYIKTKIGFKSDK